MNSEDPLARFADAARAFCSWAEDFTMPVGAGDMAAAHQHVATLYALALQLPDTDSEEIDTPSMPQQEWDAVFRRFGALPVGYYGHCFDPLVVPADDPTLGDLADDLADIWRDLKPGVMLHGQGNTRAAAWVWRSEFRYHWGRHAASALYALYCWTASAL